MEVKGQPGQSFRGSSLCVCVLNTGSQSKQLPLLATLSITLSEPDVSDVSRCFRLFVRMSGVLWHAVTKGQDRNSWCSRCSLSESAQWRFESVLWTAGLSWADWLTAIQIFTDVSSGCGRAYNWDCCGWEEAESMASTAVWPLTIYIWPVFTEKIYKMCKYTIW